MSTPNTAAFLGITEAEWLACENPVRLVKRYRDRGSGRQYVLLACAYALDVPQVALQGLGRAVVEAVRNLTFNGPSIGWSGSDMYARLPGALAAVFGRDDMPALAYGGLSTYAMNRLGPGGRVVDEVIRTAMHHSYGWRAANRTSAAVESHIKREAHREIRYEVNRIVRRPPAHGPREAVLRMLSDEDRDELAGVKWQDREVPGRIMRRVQSAATRDRLVAARRIMTDLVREVLGNPFWPPRIDPGWLLWNHGAVKHIAEQILVTGNFTDMPILADALEDAGCTDEELLRHCRKEHPHVPGCWALDAILGR
jgi:hypothetical protein